MPICWSAKVPTFNQIGLVQQGDVSNKWFTCLVSDKNPDSNNRTAGGVSLLLAGCIFFVCHVILLHSHMASKWLKRQWGRDYVTLGRTRFQPTIWKYIETIITQEASIFRFIACEAFNIGEGDGGCYWYSCYETEFGKQQQSDSFFRREGTSAEKFLGMHVHPGGTKMIRRLLSLLKTSR